MQFFQKVKFSLFAHGRELRRRASEPDSDYDGKCSLILLHFEMKHFLLI